MAVDRKLMTAEELLLLPDDGMRHELIDGELRSMAPAGAEHGDIGGPIHTHIGAFLLDHPIARIWTSDTGFLLRRNPDRVRAPDVSVVRLERIPAEGLPRGYFPGAPDLAVEVVSPGDTAPEVLEKVDDWLGAGARAVWVVYPSPVRLFVHRANGSVQQLGPDEEVDGEEILPGFRMRVRDLLHPFRR